MKLDAVLTVAVAFLVSISCCILSGAEETPAAAEFRQLERDIPSLYLINGLYFSEEQFRDLATLVDKARECEDDHGKELERIERRYRGDVEDLARDMAKRARRSEPVHRPHKTKSRHGQRLRDGRRDMHEARREYGREMQKLAGKAIDLMSESQRDILSRFSPCFIPPGDFRNPERVGQAASDRSQVVAALQRLRKVPEHLLPKARAAALEKLVGYAMHKNHISYSKVSEDAIRDRMSAHLDGMLPSIRRMSDADFELEKQRLAETLVPLDLKKKQGSEQDRRAELWKVQTYILNPGNLGVLKQRAGLAGGDDSTYRSYRCANLLDLSSEWMAAARIAALQLTPRQADKLSRVVEQVLSEQEAVEDEILVAMSDGLSAYHQLKYELADGRSTAESERQANRVHGTVKRLREERLRNALLEGEQKVDRLLSAEQVASLSERGGARRWLPGREIDIEETRRCAGRLLKDARRLSDREFDRQATDLCRAFVDESSRGYVDGIDKDAEVERTRAILERSREMDHAAYTKNKEELTAELCPVRSDPRGPTYGAKYHRGEPVPMTTPVSGILFNDAALEILKEIAKG